MTSNSPSSKTPISPHKDVTRLDAEPRLVFKIVAKLDWARATLNGEYRGSADDLRDGFIHLSLRAQVDGTLRRHFIAQEGLIVVAFDAAQLGPKLKFEISRGGEDFPHLYAPLPTALALWQTPVTRDRDGTPKVDLDPPAGLTHGARKSGAVATPPAPDPSSDLKRS